MKTKMKATMKKIGLQIIRHRLFSSTCSLEGLLFVPVLLLLSIRTFVGGERAYPLGCSLRDPSYYDYENFVLPGTDNATNGTKVTLGKYDEEEKENDNYKKNIIDVPIRSTNDFLLVRKLGAGKFSDVFEAVDAEHERQRNNISTRRRAPCTSSMIDPDTLVVLKCLKPVAEHKIRREVLILKHASKLPNLAKIKAIVIPPNFHKKNDNNKYRIRSMPTLVLAHGHGDWFCHPIKLRGNNESMKNTKTITSSASASASYLTEYEIRYYLLHLLVALDHLHSCGIMHRDVKPRNVLIDRRWTSTASSERRVLAKSPSPLTLIDLGLADFYHPGTRYNVRVASRHYKSPELLLGSTFGYYDYCIDLWGVGCILANLLFRQEPFFRGKNNVDQLGTIIQVLGTTDLLRTIAKSSRYDYLPDDVQKLINDYISQGYIHRRPWVQFLSSSTSHLSSNSVNSSKVPTQLSTTPTRVVAESAQQQQITVFHSQGMDLLDKLLVYDGSERWTARQAIYHPFFDQVRHEVLSHVRLAVETPMTVGTT